MTSTPTSPGYGNAASMNLRGKVDITQDGRSGSVVVTLPGGTRSFWWEFGGGDCIAFVSVPSPAQWAADPLLATLPRESFLQSLGEEVARQQCVGARIVIDDASIAFFR